MLDGDSLKTATALDEENLTTMFEFLHPQNQNSTYGFGASQV
jgi:hypothetical protein